MEMETAAVRVFRLALALALLLFSLVSAFGSSGAQTTSGLPPGILNVEVDNQPIDAVTVPVTANPAPEFSGRVELGVPEVELTIANGEVIKFPAPLDERGRFRISTPGRLADGQYTLTINSILIGAFAVSGSAVAPEEREPGRLLDIARVVPYPADFGGELPGLGLLDGRFFTIEEEALRAAASGQIDARAAQRGLVAAGWLQRYENRLAVPSADDPTRFTTQISSFVVEYASGADARAAFAVLVGASESADFPAIGNDSHVTLLTGVTPDTQSEYQAAKLVFRVGPMLGVIIHADLQDQPPDLALLEQVAQAVAARGAVIADRQVDPLGSMALRLDTSTASGQVFRRDVYQLRGEDLTADYGETAETLAARAEMLTGASDAFVSSTRGLFVATDRGGNRARRDRAQANATPDVRQGPTAVASMEDLTLVSEPGPQLAASPNPTEAPRPPVYAAMTTSLYAFPGEAEAEAWLAAVRERVRAEPDLDGVTTREVTDTPEYGDASFVLTTERAISDGELARGYRILARRGTIVASLEVETAPGISLRAASALMEEQLACIDAQGCRGLASLPATLFVTSD